MTFIVTGTGPQITCALVEIFQVEEVGEVVLKIYHRLFAALMVRVGSSVGVQPIKPEQVAHTDIVFQTLAPFPMAIIITGGIQSITGCGSQRSHEVVTQQKLDKSYGS